MHDIELGIFFMLDLRNQIGGGDVDEVAGGEGKEKRHIEGERRAVRDETAGQESQRLDGPIAMEVAYDESGCGMDQPQIKF